MDDFVTLGVGGAGLGTGGLPPLKGKGIGPNRDLGDLDVYPSTPMGRKGSPLHVSDGTNPPRNIGGRDYTGHALDQMQRRGLKPSVIENTIQSGQKITGKTPGTTAYYDSVNNVTVITDTASGRVVTAAAGRIRQ